MRRITPPSSKENPMELKVGQRYKRVRVEMEGQAFELTNVMVFDALSATSGRRYVIGIPATSVPEESVVAAEEDASA
jgi:hypothetical protein